MPAPRRPNPEIEGLAEAETADFLRRSSITYLECCVSLMLTHLTREEVVRILVAEARMLRELD